MDELMAWGLALFVALIVCGIIRFAIEASRPNFPWDMQTWGDKGPREKR